MSTWIRRKAKTKLQLSLFNVLKHKINNVHYFTTQIGASSPGTLLLTPRLQEGDLWQV